jgi:hypothetical protein
MQILICCIFCDYANDLLVKPFDQLIVEYYFLFVYFLLSGKLIVKQLPQAFLFPLIFSVMESYGIIAFCGFHSETYAIQALFNFFYLLIKC